jgi:catechol-2,3-dioxygenase
MARYAVIVGDADRNVSQQGPVANLHSLPTPRRKDPAMPPELDRVDHLHVFVADRAAAERWYTQVLGLQRVPELVFWASDGGPLTLGNAAGTIHIALFERPATACRSTIALGTTAACFLAWREHLAGVFGRAIEAVDHTVSWSMYFSDPDGNPYEVTTYDHAAVATALRATAA